MNANKTELICPYCGKTLKIDEIYLAQMGKEFEEKNNKTIQDAIEFHKKQADEEVERKVAEAIANTKTEQDQQTKLLKAQIEQLTNINKGQGEQMLKIQQQMMELQQKAQSAQQEAQKRLIEQTDELYEKARKEADEANATTIAGLKKQIEDGKKVSDELQRKLEQGSQQIQGEVQELELEEALRSEFPGDIVEEVAKGKNGADVIQTVVARSGRVCGKIVWESKNTKVWKSEFISKLRSDTDIVKGDLGVLVSNVFGKNMVEFTNEQGVWLIKPCNVLALARLLRDGMLKASEAKALAEHKGTIEDAVYEFVTSTAFRNRVENIGRQYRALQADIVRTKDYMNKHWASQIELLDGLVKNTQGMLGGVEAFLMPIDQNLIEKSDSE